MMFNQAALILALAAIPLASHATANFSGCTITAVSDGDSMTATCPNRKSALVIRMAEIDAPEIAHPGFHILAQPYGAEARDMLRGICLGKTASIKTTAIDRYGRTVAHVVCDGVDANSYQVANGAAWAYLVAKQSIMPGLQSSAQAKQVGLWAFPSPVQPSMWRKEGLNAGAKP